MENQGIQTLNSNLKDQSQVLVNQQEPIIQKRQVYSCQGLGNIEFPSKLKKLEEFHEQDIIQLYSLIEKMNTEIQTLKVENQNLKLLFVRQKKEVKSQVSQVQLQIEALASKFVIIEKTQQQSHRKLMKKLNYKLKNTNLKQIKWKLNAKFKQNKNFSSNSQQNVAIVVKGLDINGSNFRSEKACLSSTEQNLEHQGGYIKTVLEEFTERSCVKLLKENLGSQQQQNRQLQKDNDDLRIYLEKLEKNYKKMEEQFYQLIEEKEELSQFEIDSDEDMYS